MTVPGPALAPPPPPGPGVQPPFVAPPTDGSRNRRALAIGLTVAAAFVVLIGGILGVVGLVAVGERAIVDGSRGVVTRYLTAVQHNDFATAYNLLCTADRAQQTETQFSRSYDDASAILGFSVGNPEINSNAVQFDVPVVVRTATGDAHLTFPVVQDREAAAQFRVCGPPH